MQAKAGYFTGSCCSTPVDQPFPPEKCDVTPARNEPKRHAFTPPDLGIGRSSGRRPLETTLLKILRRDDDPPTPAAATGMKTSWRAFGVGF